MQKSMASGCIVQCVHNNILKFCRMTMISFSELMCAIVQDTNDTRLPHSSDTSPQVNYSDFRGILNLRHNLAKARLCVFVCVRVCACVRVHVCVCAHVYARVCRYHSMNNIQDHLEL